jgi:hypothetical protein
MLCLLAYLGATHLIIGDNMSSIKRVGGKALSDRLNKLKITKPARLEYGYFPNATYPNGTFVASVAAWNQYGTSKIPQRPFFSYANVTLNKKIRKIFKSHHEVDNKALNLIGEMTVNNLKKSILGYGISYVPNHPSTIVAKGSSKPLIDTGRLLNSATYKVTYI